MNRRAWLLFAAVSALWGIPYLFIKIAVSEVAPPVVVVGRTAIAAVVLLPAAIATGALRGLRGRLGLVATVAVIHVAVPFLLITYGERHISSSLTALLIATQPIMVALLALRFDPSEYMSWVRAIGLTIGFVGVAAVVGLDLSGGRDRAIGVAYVLLAALGYAAAVLLVRRRLVDVPPLGLTAATMSITAVLLAPWALLTAPRQLPSSQTMIAIVVLGLLCSAVALMLFYRLIAVAGSTRASVINYITPAVAVALGVIILHEQLRPVTLLGFVLVVIGSWLCTRRANRRPAVRRPAVRQRAVPAAEIPATVAQNSEPSPRLVHSR